MFNAIKSFLSIDITCITGNYISPSLCNIILIALPVPLSLSMMCLNNLGYQIVISRNIILLFSIIECIILTQNIWLNKNRLSNILYFIICGISLFNYLNHGIYSVYLYWIIFILCIVQLIVNIKETNMRAVMLIFIIRLLFISILKYFNFDHNIQILYFILVSSGIIDNKQKLWNWNCNLYSILIKTSLTISYIFLTYAMIMHWSIHIVFIGILMLGLCYMFYLQNNHNKASMVVWHVNVIIMLITYYIFGDIIAAYHLYPVMMWLFPYIANSFTLGADSQILDKCGQAQRWRIEWYLKCEKWISSKFS